MTDAEQRVAGLIREAFQGVTLGNGIGLRQAQGLDDYASAKMLARKRRIGRESRHLNWMNVTAVCRFSMRKGCDFTFPPI